LGYALQQHGLGPEIEELVGSALYLQSVVLEVAFGTRLGLVLGLVLGPVATAEATFYLHSQRSLVAAAAVAAIVAVSAIATSLVFEVQIVADLLKVFVTENQLVAESSDLVHLSDRQT
jgi:hypothetical protein